MSSEETRRQVAAIAHEHGLDLVVLFGSRAAGIVHAESDTDVAVARSDRPIGLDELVDVGAELSVALDDHVDVVDLHRADPLLLRQIFRQPIPLFTEADAFEREALRAFHRYEDYRPFLALERQAVQRRLLRRP